MVKRVAFLVIVVAACTSDGHNEGGTKCGDGIVNPVAGEQCDDGDANGNDGHCSETCMNVVSHDCGDSIIQPEEGEECDDGNTVSGDGCSAACKVEVNAVSHNVYVAWNIETLAGVHQPQCPAGFTTAVLTSVPLGADGMPSGPGKPAQFACNAGTGLTSLPEGKYSMSLAITSEGGATYASDPTPTIVDLNADYHFSTPIYTDAGYVRFAWALVKATDHTPTDCVHAGIGTGGIRLTVTSPAAMTSSSFTIPCDAKNGLSAPLVFDTYAVKVQATGNGMVVLGTAAPTMVTLTDPNAAKDLGTVTIPIDAL